MKRLFIVCFGIITMMMTSASVIVEDPFAILLKKLAEFTKKYPNESIHLHLDKPYYAIGDNIWFKAYVVDSRTAAVSNLSKILYVELIDERDSLRTKLRLPMENGISWGDFKLPDTLSEGNYRIRAYTQWMRNAGPDFFFDKTIKIGNSWANKVFVKADYTFSMDGSNEKVGNSIRFLNKEEKPYANAEVNYEVKLGVSIISRGKTVTNDLGEISIPIINREPGSSKSGAIHATLSLPDKRKVTKIIPLKATSSIIDVQFFAEGGNLIANLPNNIAFKAINSEGKGEEIDGIIIDNDGEEITSFKTSHLGMGSFSLVPMEGKSYRAQVRGTFFNLPKHEATGYVLSVNNNDTSKVVVKILLTEDLIGKGDLQLLAQKDGKVYFSVKIPTTKNYAVANLPKAELPSGITTLTLFNSASLPVAERLIFVNNQFDKLKIDITNFKESYKKRDSVKLELAVSNEAVPTQGSFSIAVNNASLVEPDLANESNIFSSLLLKSELKGYIEKPNLYFTENNSEIKPNIDYLMLTQGWRKIDWKAVNESQLVVQEFKPETGLEISGSLTTLGQRPVANGKVSLFSSSMGIVAIDTLTDESGKFNFSDLQFPDSTKFVINGFNEKGKKDVMIKLNIVPKQQITSNKNRGDIEVNVNEQLRNYLKSSDDYFDEQTKKGLLTRTIQLEKVDIVGQKKQPPATSSLAGAGRADATYTAKDLKNSTSLVDFLNAKARLLLFKGSPTIVIDGMIMPFTVSTSSSGGIGLDGYSPQNIETIEILSSSSNTSIYGIRGGNGVIVITSKQGGSTEEEVESSNPVIHNPKGYSLIRQFYSPRYDIESDTKPDFRTTIYWNPSIVSGGDGKFKLDYFNSDKPGIYRVVIEGIDLMGNLGRRTFTYEVK
ncbi:MAG: TonB-dependent receptor [Bacteroidia bacterium]